MYVLQWYHVIILHAVIYGVLVSSMINFVIVHGCFEHNNPPENKCMILYFLL